MDVFFIFSFIGIICVIFYFLNRKYLNIYLDKLNINPNTLNTGVNLYSIAIKQWEIQFGDKTFATDFANRIIFKDKFGSNIEGGWNIDYFDKDSTGVFVASSLTIAERSGKKKFVIDNVEYNIIKDNNKKLWTKI